MENSRTFKKYSNTHTHTHIRFTSRVCVEGEGTLPYGAPVVSFVVASLATRLLGSVWTHSNSLARQEC